MLLDSARKIVQALETVEKAQAELLHSSAEKSTTWPVMLSPNPQDIEAAKQHVKRLNVGSKADTPRRAGQRVDPRNFWTGLAENAFKVCRDCMVIVPLLERHCVGVKPHPQTRKAWQTLIAIEIYPVSPTDQIVISEWEKRCAKLSLPVTTKNIDQWWDCVRDSLSEYWWVFRDEYKAALENVRTGPADILPEYERRGLAFGRVKQAFKSLLTLQTQ